MLKQQLKCCYNNYTTTIHLTTSIQRSKLNDVKTIYKNV